MGLFGMRKKNRITVKATNQPILKGKGETVSSPTSVEMINQLTFSQDDDIDEEVAAHDFPITLIELLNDLEATRETHLIKAQTTESRLSYDGDRDSVDSSIEHNCNNARGKVNRSTAPRMYKDELLSTWSPELTDGSTHQQETSNDPLVIEDDPSIDDLEHDLTNFASSKDDESSAGESQPQLFMGWCGIMMCTQNDSNLDHSPSDDEDESSWKKDNSKETAVVGRRHLLKDDDCIYLTNEASISVHDSITTSRHYRTTGQKRRSLLKQLSHSTHHYQVAAVSETQKIMSVDTTCTERRATNDDTHHLVGCFRRELCMNTDDLKDFKDDFCVVPEDFKSFDQVGGRHDSLEDAKSTYETILVESHHRLYETLVLSASQELDNDVQLNPRHTETSGEDSIPIPPAMTAWEHIDETSTHDLVTNYYKDITGTMDKEAKQMIQSSPLNIVTSTNTNLSNLTAERAPKQIGLSSKESATLSVIHTQFLQSDHGMRRNRTIDFSERRQGIPADFDLLSEASDVLSIDGYGDENLQNSHGQNLLSNTKEGNMFKRQPTDDDSDLEWFHSSRFSLEASSKPLILLMDDIVLSNAGLEDGPVDSGETSVCNNLTSTGKEADTTIQYLLDDSYDSEPEPQVSGFADDEWDDESLIDYESLEQQIYNYLTSEKLPGTG